MNGQDPTYQRLAPRPKAAALRYEPLAAEAPRVVAKGEGHLAEKLLEIARRHDVPIRQDKNLVEILCQLDLDAEIPEHLYRVVAEILAFVYQLSGKQLDDSRSDESEG